MGKDIFVFADWAGLKGPTLMGILHADALKGKEVFSFEYDDRWLEDHTDSVFDADLQFYKGRQYVQTGKQLFGVFTDSCPDRWGRILMKRREAIIAKEEGRPQKTLLESDYLLGIQDIARMGALRFKTEMNGPFLDYDADYPVPVWTGIRELEQAAIFIDSEEGDYRKQKDWLRILVQPGSSLGGARPKATVQDTQGNLWIAKFPSKKDDINTGAWEMVVHDLAKSCGINVPEAKCERFSDTGSTYIAKRFDREGSRRIHFLSAMTVLGETDGSDAESGVSYLDIASAIRQYGSNPRTDLLELWKRIVFSIAVTNTDDHLRNHGFLQDSKGIRLSPMYDVNPNPDGTALSLNINETSNELDFELAIQSAPYFDIAKADAAEIVKEINSKIAFWPYLAKTNGISSGEISMMETCFRCAACS